MFLKAQLLFQLNYKLKGLRSTKISNGKNIHCKQRKHEFKVQLTIDDTYATYKKMTIKFSKFNKNQLKTNFLNNFSSEKFGEFPPSNTGR